MGPRNRCFLSPYCTSVTSGNGNEKYYSIPKVKAGPMCELTKQLIQKRRYLWLKALGLTEADTEREPILVCSKHFVSGKPDVGVDWVPSLNIPIPKIIPVPPPTEEHSYCQSTVPPTAYQWKTTVSVKKKRLLSQRRSRRLPILKKKKEKAIEKATKAEKKAKDIEVKIREKKWKKKRLAIKKAKREAKIKIAEREAALLLRKNNKKNKVLPEPNANQIESIDMQLPSAEDHFDTSFTRISEISKQFNTSGNDSINTEVKDMSNTLPPVSSISPTVSNGHLIISGPSAQQQHVEANLVVASTDKVTPLATSVSKNEFLQLLSLSQIGQGSGRKSTPVKIAPKSRDSNAPKRVTEPLKNTVKLPSKILIVRKDAFDKTSRTVITLKSSLNTPPHIVQKNVGKIVQQIQAPPSSTTLQQQPKLAGNSTPTIKCKAFSSTDPALKTNVAEPLKILQPAAKTLILKKGEPAKTSPTVAAQTKSANPSCPVLPKNTEVVSRMEMMEPSSPVPQNELISQNLRNIDTYIRDLMLKKNPTAQDTNLSSLLLNLINHHQKNILDPGKPAAQAQAQAQASTARVTRDSANHEVVDLTKDDCDYILPDVAAPNNLRPTCNCRNYVEEATSLRYQLEQKSVALEACNSDIDNLKKELREAKEYISNLAGQLQENTQTLCSILANSPHEIRK